ncbi:MAG: SDR family NAD(P)-dependent oxidoreductase [Bacteroidales bacterium]|nr:SDR family NAD(P)-dependent oxidoreductase [Bacteroidales bacterium]
MKKIVIIGASSGMGAKCAEIFAQKGYKVAIAARREKNLQAIQNKYPDNVIYALIDVTKEDAPSRLISLIERNGGMDIYFHISGIGFHNEELDVEKEFSTLEVNALGFTRMITATYKYFKENSHGGHIACISSIAGTKGLGAAPSYSATKSYQNVYLQSLAQLSRMDKSGITFTDIRPGFVKTELLDTERNYPLLMNADKVSRQIVRAIEKKKRIKVVNNLYSLITFFWRLIPDWLWIRLKIKN